MKKLLFVHQVSSVGGASFCLLNLLRSVDGSLVTPMVLLKDEGPLVEEIRKLDIQVDFMPTMDVAPYNTSFRKPGTWVTYLSAFTSRGTFRKKLNQLKPDILYLNNSMLYPYLDIAQRMGIKTIIHVREHWPMDEHVWQLRLLQNAIRKYADRIVAINEYSAKMVSCPEKDIRIVYDWIDFSNRFIEHDLNSIFGEDVSRKKVFLFTGGMQPIKGCHEVLTAFSQYSDTDARLLALGVEKEQKDIADIIKKDNRIACMPAVYEIKDLLEKCYCMLSYFTIPHANLALAESITLKLPVIAARTEESEEYSNGGKLAILFEINNLTDFQEKLNSFDKQKDQIKAYLDRDSHLIAEKFDKSRNVEVFRRTIDSVL